MIAISTKRLQKSFMTGIFKHRETRVLNDVTFDLAEGQLLMLMGKNGSGKSTLLKILATLVLPSSGEASILGHDLYQEEASIRAKIAMVSGDDRGFYTRLSCLENLR